VAPQLGAVEMLCHGYGSDHRCPLNAPM
jgi:hypothetical protein